MKGRRWGQGMTEYVVVVGLIAIGLVAAVKGLGLVLERSYGKVTGKVEGLSGNIAAGTELRDRGAPMPASRRALTVPADSCLHPTVSAGVCQSCGESL
jgi:Flp pilus assembly pilin Flp